MASLSIRSAPLRRRSLQQVTSIPAVTMPSANSAGSALQQLRLTPRTSAIQACRQQLFSTTASSGGSSSMLTSTTMTTTRHTASSSFPRTARSSDAHHLMMLPSWSVKTRMRPRSSTSSAAPPKRSQSTIVPQMGGGAGGSAGRVGTQSTGASGGGSASTSVNAGGQAPRWRDIFYMLREATNASLLKPRTLPIPRWIAPKHYTVTFSECFGHASFILVAASYATDDFVLLRSIAVTGSTAMLVFTYFHPHGRVLWLPFKWNVLFIAINSYRLGLIMYQKYLTDMMPEEMKRIREEHFYVVDPIDWSKLIRSGREETYEPGALIVQQGDMNRYIRLVIDGEVEVVRDGQVTYLLEEGNFVSESGLHAGIMLAGAVESCAGVVAKRESQSKVRVLTWDRTELMELLEQEKSMRSALKAALSWDIIRKLKAQRLMLASGNVENPALWTAKRKEQGAERYAAILHNMLSHPNPHEHIGQLTKYRAIHHIDDEQHRLALAKCGWTVEEFESGERLQRVDDDDDEWDDDDDEESLSHEWKRKAARIARVLK